MTDRMADRSRAPFVSRLKTLAHHWVFDHVDAPNIERLRIISRCVQEIRNSYAPVAHPSVGEVIGLEDVREALVEMGISPGDVIHVQSSATHLFAGGSPIGLATQTVRMLIELVGPSGTILMNTDSLRNGWDHAASGEVFDYASWPSRRGLISEVFRRRSDVVRSVHPWYNVTAWGCLAVELLEDHHKSTPYTMDEHSPWYKLNLVKGKVALLGAGFRYNSPLHLAEYLNPKGYPRAIFLDRPVAMKFMTWKRQQQVMDVMLHAPVWKHGAEGRFGAYLNVKYGIYRTRTLRNGAQIVVYDAADQCKAVRRELEQGTTWYDPQFWPPSN